MEILLKISNPTIYTSTWLPIGKSNMEALNRFVGAHKRYTTPTEFGNSGYVENMESGVFKVKNHGVFLTPVAYEFANYLHANIKEEYNSEKVYGLSVYKNGLAGIGISVQEELTTDEIKFISGKLAYKIVDCIFPILNDVQQSLISTIIREPILSKAHHKIQVYSLIKAKEISVPGSNSTEILKNDSDSIESITDWVTDHTSFSNCHVFIGMDATLCIGEVNSETEKALRLIQFLLTCNKSSHHLHSLLWSLRKKVHSLREKSDEANYKILKSNNEEICTYNTLLLKLKVFDSLLKEETAEMAGIWQELNWGKSEFSHRIYHRYLDEVEKSENRKITINQLTEELDVLSTELENKLELIMTRDSMTMNIILLVLTIISLFGVGEVAGFTEKQWGIVAIVMVPFTTVTLIYLNNYIKNFKKR